MSCCLAISGAVVWVFGTSPATGAHVLMEKLLLGLISAHIGSALSRDLIRRYDVVVRMFAPERP
jgi:cytochrome b561